MQQWIGLLVTLAGAIYVALSSYLLAHLPWMAATLEEATKTFSNNKMISLDPVAWKWGALANMSLYFVVGAAALICGLGLRHQRRSARPAWLAISGLLLGLVVLEGAALGSWGHIDLALLAATSIFLWRSRAAI